MENIQDRTERVGNEINGAKNDLVSKFNQIKGKAEQVGQQVVDGAKTVAKEVKEEGQEIADQLYDQTSRSLDSVRTYVTNNPFRSIAAAVGIGVLVGYLRRR